LELYLDILHSISPQMDTHILKQKTIISAQFVGAKFSKSLEIII
jgi:hypothetical protein